MPKYRYRQKLADYRPILILLLAFVVLAALYFTSQIRMPPTTTTTTTTTTVVTTTTLPATTTTTITLQPAKGTLIIALKDVVHKIPGGTVIHSLNLTISNISIHRAGQTEEENETANETTDEAANETGQWFSVFSGRKSLDLLKYTDVHAIVGEAELDEGKYTQIRLSIPEANITITNAYLYIYRNKTYPMIIPSKELKLVNPFTIEAGKTSVLTLDFDVEQSVTRTADGYMLKPVVKILEETLEAGERPANAVVV